VPIGAVRGALGLAFCVFSIVQIGAMILVALTETDVASSADVALVAALLIAGISGVVGGWRWSERRSGGWWVLAALVTDVTAIALVAVTRA